jgi:hypothetical protein
MHLRRRFELHWVPRLRQYDLDRRINWELGEPSCDAPSLYLYGNLGGRITMRRAIIALKRSTRKKVYIYPRDRLDGGGTTVRSPSFGTLWLKGDGSFNYYPSESTKYGTAKKFIKQLIFVHFVHCYVK